MPNSENGYILKSDALAKIHTYLCQIALDTSLRKVVPYIQKVFDHVSEMPTVDMVQVVRCKSCKFVRWSNKERRYYCARSWAMHKVRDRDFCSYGQRKVRPHERSKKNPEIP